MQELLIMLSKSLNCILKVEHEIVDILCQHYQDLRVIYVILLVVLNEVCVKYRVIPDRNKRQLFMILFEID